MLNALFFSFQHKACIVELANSLAIGQRRGAEFVAPKRASRRVLRQNILFVAPSIVLPLTCWSFDQFGLVSWQTVILIAIIVSALARQRLQLWPTRDARSRFPAGISVAAIVWIITLHWHTLWPSGAGSFSLHVLGLVAECGVVIGFLYSILADPGKYSFFFSPFICIF